MPNIRQAYLSMAESLLLHGNDPAFATHDDFLIEAIQRFVDERGIDRERFEFQMLFGLRPGRQEELRRQGYRMRVYVPFGAEWMPYFYRRLRERKENVWFVLRNLFRK
jgi:proline dehydrogenase